MSDVGAAHRVSLPLLSFLREMDERPPVEVALLLMQKITALKIEHDVQGILVFHDGVVSVTIEPCSRLGEQIVSDLLHSAEFLPCPPGTCEYVGTVCKWCGGSTS